MSDTTVYEKVERLIRAAVLAERVRVLREVTFDLMPVASCREAVILRGRLDASLRAAETALKEATK